MSPSDGNGLPIKGDLGCFHLAAVTVESHGELPRGDLSPTDKWPNRESPPGDLSPTNQTGSDSAAPWD